MWVLGRFRFFYEDNLFTDAFRFFFENTVNTRLLLQCLKKNQNAPRPSEHLSIPQLGGKNVKTSRLDQRLQIQNLFMAFKPD